MKDITNRSTCHTKEGTARQAIEEPRNNHSLDVCCHGAWNQPYQEERE